MKVGPRAGERADSRQGRASEMTQQLISQDARQKGPALVFDEPDGAIRVRALEVPHFQIRIGSKVEALGQRQYRDPQSVPYQVDDDPDGIDLDRLVRAQAVAPHDVVDQDA